MPKMPNMCYRYSQDVLKTCQGDAQDFPIMLKICESRKDHQLTHWLALQHGSKRCLRNAHPKNVFLYFVILLRENTFSEGHFISEIQRMFRDAHCSVSISLIFSVLDSGWKKMISRFLQRRPSITLWDGAGMVIVVKHRNGRKKERSNFIGFQCRNSRDNASPRLSRWSSSEMKLHLFATKAAPLRWTGRNTVYFCFFTALVLASAKRSIPFRLWSPFSSWP